MKLKLERPLIVFDTETTGTDPQQDRIVELATLKIMPDGSREEKCKRFNPLVPIPKDATAVHGISDADVKDEPPFSKVGVAEYFAGCDLAGYNVIGFDIPILKAELERAGKKLDTSAINVIDAFKIFISREPRDLTGALRFYCGKEHGTAHSAMGDVQATADVLAAQLEKYEDLPDDPSLLDLHLRGPDGVDRSGKLKWIGGEISVAFGRHKGKSLRDLARNETDYIRWMIQNDVIDGDGANHLHDALLGQFSKRDEKTNS